MPAPTIPINDLSRALSAQAPLLEQAFAEVIASGWLVMGPQHQQFEQELATYVGADYAVGVASGTDALELALRALMPPGRNIVVTTANCGGYTTIAARRAGFSVRYVDVSTDTGLLDLSALSTALTGDVGVVVVTHLYGQAADAEAVVRLCHAVGAMVLEDCAQAIGAQTVNGKSVGSIGDAAAFSFYPTKNLGALGDGGAVTTSDAQVVERLKQLRQYGWVSKYTIGTDGGRNSRLDEVQAAILRKRLPMLDGWNQRRREILAQYCQVDNPKLQWLTLPTAQNVGHLAVVKVADRADFRSHLENHQVQTDIHYPVPDHQQPYLADLPPGLQAPVPFSLPVTEQLTAQIVTVPLFPELTDDEVARVCHALRTY